MVLLEAAQAIASTARPGGGAVPQLVVLRPVGVLDAQNLARLDEDVAEAGAAPVVIDLGQCTLSVPGILALLEPRRWGREASEVCLVSRRLTSRRLLAKTNVTLAVFGDVRDATQARVLGAAGYGAGWGAG